MSKIYILSILSLLIMGCQPTLDPHQYMVWSQGNHDIGVSSHETESYRVSLRYQPKELIFLQRGGAHLPESNQEVLWKEIEGMDFFTVELTPKGAEKVTLEDNYYFSYRFSEDIELEGAGQAAGPVLFHYERSNDLGSKKTFVMGFETPMGADGARKKVRIYNERISPAPIELEVQTNKFPKLRL
ncbi:hypothetical protein KIH41_17355 [Litoribacter ruber]|uniref:hypothetical protein n=1 Tax=Litoribacter ruber TaxID=702568 RepID=UPI001BDAC726|nr:hypothetical protein [Litoribacter ruber]MBT0813059.1 hypothetical protein [Litoribacter ruber]